MRTGLLTALLALCVALPVQAAGVDPLAALEGDRTMDARSNGKRPKDKLDPLATMVPVKPQTTVTLPAAAAEAMPPSFNTGGNTGGFTPSALPVPTNGPPPGGGVWAGPTAPTPPTLPTIMGPTAPLWKFGD
ncbi:MAG: hypothetical protein H7Z12_20085 [Rhodospirillaceae bacterium]|nr:hypothetical protein [Rhodospirillales bacterium]